MYAYSMEPAATLERKAFFVEPKALKTARRILRARSDGETVRLALARVKEIEESWKPLLKLAGAAKRESFTEI
jgi:hypothetical protein